MATVVSSSTVNQTLAITKKDCGKLADAWRKGQLKNFDLSSTFYDVLVGIVNSADTTNLSTN